MAERKPRLILGLLCLLWIFGAPLQAQEEVTEPDLRFGVLPVLNTLPIHVAQAAGYFEAAGVSVELVPLGSAADLRLALYSGMLDGIQANLVTALVMNSGGVSLRLVRHNQMKKIPFSALVASPWSDIETAADLAGADIGISQHTVIHFLTDQLLEHAGVDAASVRYEDVENVLSRLYLLVQGRLAAATLPQPHIKMAVDAGGRVLVDDSVLDFIPEAVSFRTEVLTEKAAAVRAFLVAYERAVAAINDMNGSTAAFQEALYREESARALLNRQLPPELFFSLAVTIPKFYAASVPSEAEYDAVHDWALANGIIGAAQAYEDVVDGAYLPEIAAEDRQMAVESGEADE